MRILTLFLILSFSACSCSESGDPDGGQPPFDGTTDGTVDGDQPDGDQPDGDQPDGDQPDGDQPDGDVVEYCADGEVKQATTLCTSGEGAGFVFACGNGCDDDLDGLIDLDDPECGNDPCHDSEEPALCPDGSLQGVVTACSGFVYECGNGCDDDGDGKIDLADPECEGNPCHVSETVTAGGGQIIPCGGSIFQCGNGIDDDGDGLADSWDPDCLGPCDNNEEGLYHNLPGGGSGEGSCTIDCYFDENSGSGGGDCEWDVRCDPLSPGAEWQGSNCSYSPTKVKNPDCNTAANDQYTANENCQSNCEWRTPNGCDCFGCCLFPTETNPNRYLFIGSKDSSGNKLCTLADAQTENPVHCDECTPVPSCLNECGTCEICLGKDTLPDECFPPPPPADGGVPDGSVEDAGDPPPPPRCADGVQPCGQPGDSLCGAGFYCITGCCIYFGGVG
jgi:hypothetical protein